ncbi:MAG: hypothetical protein Q9160_001166 [Pyrenula sp. 1 TL-2023]
MSSRKVVQYGLTEVYATSDPVVDIVLVHGLNGHPYNTWATHKPDVYWPNELLPQTLDQQRIRILTYGYDAGVTAFTDGTSKDKIHNHAEHLAGKLVANRSLKKALERPLIFVCHSLGGLVVKRCLIYCKSVRHPHLERLRSIYVSTYGILFLGTPHNGSDIARWGTLLQSICSAMLPKKFFDSSPHLVEALRTNNETLQNINRLFVDIIGRFQIYFFHESRPMDLKGTRQLVVEEDSAAPVIEGVERMGIERDHSNMCKFEDETSPGFDVVAEALMRYSEAAPPVIQMRWVEERQLRDLEKNAAARELLGESLPSASQSTTSASAGLSAPLSKADSIGGPPKSLPNVEYEVEEVDDEAQRLFSR